MLARWRRDLFKNARQVNTSLQLPPGLWLAAQGRSYHSPSTRDVSKPSSLSFAFKAAAELKSGRNPQPQWHSSECYAAEPNTKWSSAAFFTHLHNLLDDKNTTATSLWKFLVEAYPAKTVPNAESLSTYHRSLLGEVLQRNLDEWATESTSSDQSRPTRMLRFFSCNKMITVNDWIYCLGFLARVVYRNTAVNPDQSTRRNLKKEVADATQLRTLCKAWRLFLKCDHSSDVTMSRNKAGSYEMLWPELRGQHLQPEDRNETPFLHHFTRGSGVSYSIDEPELAHRLFHTSIITLVAVYNNLRMFYSTKQDCDEVSPKDGVVASDSGSDDPEPNWHLGSGQAAYWAPEICHLSVTEAMILCVLAQAANDAPTNQTLLRITLPEILPPGSDFDIIIKTYQGFRMAVPKILERFREFEYNKDVYNAGLPRRYPLRARLNAVMESNDIESLDHVASFSHMSNNADDGLTLVKAYLQMDRPGKALEQADRLTFSSGHQDKAYKACLSHLYDKKDHVAFEAAWQRTEVKGLRHNQDMWCRRLRLLHQEGQSEQAWDHFCTLVRFSGRNKILRGLHIGTTTTFNLSNDVFHLMIESFLENETLGKLSVAKAADTLQLLRGQWNLRPTRETYMLFIRHALQKLDRQSAVDFFGQGRALKIDFSPSDLVRLFEYDLANRDQAGEGPLANSTSSIESSLDAISRILRLGHGRRRLFLRQTGSGSAWILSTLQKMPWVDDVKDELPDFTMKENQTLYTKVMRHLAIQYPTQLPGAAKTARLRLLLLLWDHCTAIAGIPPSTGMEAVLRSIVMGNLHPDLQEKLLRGSMFQNCNPQNSLHFHSFRFLRRIGPQWFIDRLIEARVFYPLENDNDFSGVDLDADITSKLTRLPWHGYPGVKEESLASVGIGLEQGGRVILDQISRWKQQAMSKRLEAAEERKEKRLKRKKVGRSVMALPKKGYSEPPSFCHPAPAAPPLIQLPAP